MKISFSSFKRKIFLLALRIINKICHKHPELIDLALLEIASTASSPDIAQAANAFNSLQPFDNGCKLILVGDGNDGSYNIPDDDLSTVLGVVSPGVGGESSFEEYFLGISDCRVIALDPSINTLPASFESDRVQFIDRFLASDDSASSMTLSRVVADYFPQSPPASLVLQLDIEGGEYFAIASTSYEVLDKFRIIAVEIHCLEAITSPVFVNNIFKPFIEKLSSGFDLVHFHPNNACPTWDLGKTSGLPSVIELTWHHKSRRMTDNLELKPTHSIDSDILNDRSSAHVVVNFPLHG